MAYFMLAIIACLVSVTNGALKPCAANDYKFTYTECDSDDSRWRVAVPKHDDCLLRNAPVPEVGINCTFSCAPGEYLDVVTQKCVGCPAGKYSVGDGKRFAEWSKLPDGFKTYGMDPESTVHSSVLKKRKKRDAEDKCEKSVWNLREHYIESAGSSCKSVLVYEINNLLKDGSVTFSARANDDDAFFHVWVEDSKTCDGDYSEYSDPGSEDKETYVRPSSEWTSYTLSLSKGRNKVYFVAAYFNRYNYGEDESDEDKYSSNNARTVMIQDIVVRGFSFSEFCEPCEPGSFSGPGSASCSDCPENTHSDAAAGHCTKCNEDEYSAKGSSTCHKRSPCTEDDYHMEWEGCNMGKTRKVYSWNEPHKCSESLPGAKALPPASDLVDCPPCNPGQYHNASIGCSFCPRGTYNTLGKGNCTKCPPSTEDAPSINYRNWRELPGAPMHLFCLSETKGCRSEKGWQVYEDHISSGIGHSDDAEMVMYILVNGFTKDESQIKIDFSVECEGKEDCRFMLQSVEHGNVHRLESWEGPVERTTYTYHRHSKLGMRYRIVFEKAYDDEEQTFRFTRSNVRIYSIEVTNAENGGTAQCEGCIVNMDSNCVSCKKGEYMEKSTKKCQKCPSGTFISDQIDAVEGISACKPCPGNTVSKAGSTVCYSDCKITALDGNVYDFSPLNGSHTLKGQQMFTAKGYPFYHEYNISICGTGPSLVQCRNNITDVDDTGAELTVQASICRSTMIPDGSNELSVQAFSIGNTLSSIEEHLSTSANDATSDNHTAVTDLSSESNEFVFTFHSNRYTERCKNGSKAVVRLRCDPTKTGLGFMHSGDKKCTSETCDGCSFPITWHTHLACPICSKRDYVTINTACVKGFKKTHYIWKTPRICHGGVVKPEDTESECTIFEKNILDLKVFILIFLGVGILLAVIVLFLCYRNRKLSYRYHKLIDASQMKDGELPPSEVCTLEEGEDEDDDMVLSRGKGGGKRILDKLKNIGGKKDNRFSDFSTINLDEKENGLLDSGNDDEDEL